MNAYKSELYFQWGEELGKGSFGRVVSAFYKPLEHEVAVKVLKTEREIPMEIKLHEKLDHPNIVNLLKTIIFGEEEEGILMIMEHMKGGSLNTLSKKIQKEEVNVSELDISIMMKGVLEGLAYLHKLDIVHRDIKPGNLLLSDKDSLSVKIGDFGMSKECKNTVSFNLLDEKYGTLLYIAPEVIYSKQYYKPIDIWSLGVTLYELLGKGQHPLGDRKLMDTESFKSLLANPHITYPPSFSKLSINFLQHLLNVTPSQRYTAQEALTHPWITRKFASIPQTMGEKMDNFMSSDFLKRIINCILFAARSSNLQIPEIYRKKIIRASEKTKQWFKNLEPEFTTDGDYLLSEGPEPSPDAPRSPMKKKNNFFNNLQERENKEFMIKRLKKARSFNNKKETTQPIVKIPERRIMSKIEQKINAQKKLERTSSEATMNKTKAINTPKFSIHPHKESKHSLPSVQGKSLAPLNNKSSKFLRQQLSEKGLKTTAYNNNRNSSISQQEINKFKENRSYSYKSLRGSIIEYREGGVVPIPNINMGEIETMQKVKAPILQLLEHEVYKSRIKNSIIRENYKTYTPKNIRTMINLGIDLQPHKPASQDSVQGKVIDRNHIFIGDKKKPSGFKEYSMRHLQFA